MPHPLPSLQLLLLQLPLRHISKTLLLLFALSVLLLERASELRAPNKRTGKQSTTLCELNLPGGASVAQPNSMANFSGKPLNRMDSARDVLHHHHLL